MQPAIRNLSALMILTGTLLCPVQAQGISGTVVDDSTSQAIAAAEVSILDTAGVVVSQALTDSTGRFQVNVLPGRYSFRVLRIGYTPTVTTEISTTPSESQVRVTIRVPTQSAVEADQPYALSPVVVEAQPVRRYLAGFHRHAAIGMGDHVLREEFEQWHPRQVTDVVRRMQGFTILPNVNYGRPLPDGSIDMREYIIDVPGRAHHRTGPLTECPPLIFLDGALFGNSQRFDINDLPLDAIAAVETYGRTIATPVEYVRPGNECGVVALWTRSAEPGQAGSPFELGVRYGGTVVGGAFVGGRFGIHLLTRFAGPFEFYPAIYFISSAFSSNQTLENSGWMAQLALRTTLLETPVPLYVGSGLIVVKPHAWYMAVETDVDIDPRYTVLTGAKYDIDFLHPFVELHLLDFLSSSAIAAQLFTGIGVQF